MENSGLTAFCMWKWLKGIWFLFDLISIKNCFVQQLLLWNSSTCQSWFTYISALCLKSTGGMLTSGHSQNKAKILFLVKYILQSLTRVNCAPLAQFQLSSCVKPPDHIVCLHTHSCKMWAGAAGFSHENFRPFKDQTSGGITSQTVIMASE